MLTRGSAAASQEAKSPGVALGLSTGLPLAGLAMIAAAALPSGDIQTWQNVSLISGMGLVLIGPSGGSIYTGHSGRGVAFTVGRLGFAALALAFVAEGMSHSDVSDPGYVHGAAKTSMIQAGVCGAGILALSVWESVASYRSAVETNRSSQRALSFTPMFVAGRGGALPTGFRLAGTF